MRPEPNRMGDRLVGQPASETLQAAPEDDLATQETWFASLAPEKRAAVRALSQVRPLGNLAAPAFVLLWFVTCYLVLRFPFWPARLVGYVIMGASIHALGILMHEAVHGN